MNKNIRDIRYGIVVDHITPGNGGRVSKVIKDNIWPGTIMPVYTGEGCPSTRNARKDIVKLDGRMDYPTGMLNEIAVTEPDSTVNWIEKGKVVRKSHARSLLADSIETDIVECDNANCISHGAAPGKYQVLKREPIKLRCYYCEREFDLE